MYVRLDGAALVAALDELYRLAPDAGARLSLRAGGRSLTLRAGQASVRVPAAVLRRGGAEIDPARLREAIGGAEAVALCDMAGGRLAVYRDAPSAVLDGGPARGERLAAFLERPGFRRFRWAVLALLMLATAVIAVPWLVRDLRNELEPLYNTDANYYFGIGRALTQGYRLYSELFDIKPPGIFYTAALSFALTDGFHLTNYFCFAALCLTGLAPVLAVCLDARRCGLDRLQTAELLLPALLLGSTLALYAHICTGHVQVEAFGACFGTLYVLLAGAMPVERMKPWSPYVLLTAFVLMLSPMYKEPFAFVALAAGLLLSRDGKQLLYRVALPMLYGGAMGVALLLATGNLSGYVGIYLRYMLETAVGDTAGKFFAVGVVARNLWNMSPAVAAAMLALIVGAAAGILRDILRRPRTAAGLSMTLLDVVKLPLGVGLTCMAIGTTGAYFPHHFAFGIPFYAALAVWNARWIGECVRGREAARALAGVAAGLAVAAALLWGFPTFNMYETGLIDESPEMQAEADYIDGVLDALGEERYQYFGFNGQCVNFYTRHIPLGPIFVQDWMKISAANRLGEQLMAQLQRANVAVVQNLNCGDLTGAVERILDTEFTETPPPGIEPPGDGFECRILYRIKG